MKLLKSGKLNEKFNLEMPLYYVAYDVDLYAFKEIAENVMRAERELLDYLEVRFQEPEVSFLEFEEFPSFFVAMNSGSVTHTRTVGT